MLRSFFATTSQFDPNTSLGVQILFGCSIAHTSVASGSFSLWFVKGVRENVTPTIDDVFFFFFVW